MKILDRVLYLWIALFALAVMSCGGGSSSSLLAGGGIGGTGATSVGEITEFGSIWVNGVEFDTGSADVYVNDIFIGSGEQAILRNMDVGRIVLVKGRLLSQESGEADSVYYGSTVSGPVDVVETIDSYTLRLTILGQTVIVDDRTYLKGVDLDALEPGNFVDVSGFFESAGEILAVFLEKTSDVVPTDADYIVTGAVSNLNKDAMTFTINSLTVDYSQANMSDFDSMEIEDGIFVSISGRNEDDGAVFIADTVGPFLKLDEGYGDEIEMEGLVGSALSESRFSLNGVTVEINVSTEYVNGTADEILPGTRVEVEGTLDSGVIVAEKVIFSNLLFRAESDLLEKNDDDLLLVLAGLEQITVHTNDLTHFIGLAAGTGFDGLTAGNHLVIKGYLVEDQTVMASQVIGLPEVQDKVLLRGALTAISDPVLTINGVAIDTDLIPSGGFFGNDETAVSREAFLGLVANGDWVEAKGQLQGDSVEWQSLTIVQVQE